MKISMDWHVHSRHSCDCAGTGMSVGEIVATARARGIGAVGLADHLHTPVNLPSLRASREEFLAFGPCPSLRFGVEVSCVSRWELDEIATGRHGNPVYGLREGGPANGPLALGLTRDDIDALGIEYVVGGTHWPMYVPFEREALIRDYHRQNLFLATHPLVDVVAHPWWFHTGYWKTSCPPGEPWFDDFGRIPASMHEEFAAAAVSCRTAVEINMGAMLLNDAAKYPESFKRAYLEYLAGLKARGVRLTLGSDAHNLQQYCAMDLEGAARMLDSVGIVAADLWQPAPSSKR